MPVPTSSIASRTARRSVALLLMALSCTSLRGATRQSETRITLESLGCAPFPANVLSSGASILTLNYVDDRHLLVTFAVRRLLKRIPDDPPQDTDRSIDAVLVDLPSGNILARTAWRLHDPAQYLWPLGKGHFLLRIRDRLTTISPLLDLKSGDAFKEHPLLSSPRPIGAILLSPDASLLVLESLDHLPPVPPEQRPPSPGTSAYAAAQAAAKAAEEAAKKEAAAAKSSTPVAIQFFRIQTKEDGELYAQSSGSIRARSLVSIPADGAGFISVLDEGRHHWAFNYNFYRGKVEELSPFDSTCHPSPILVSRSEFIAFGCRSGNQRQMLGGFNLRGEEMWEQTIPENYLNPGFAFAPAAGRFAFGRVTTAAVIGDPATSAIASGQYSSQIVTVFQTDSGRQVLRQECTPVFPSGQNFDLSPDGADLAIIRDSAVEIHHLPPLSSRDRAGVAKAAALAPEPSEGPVLLSAPLSNANAREAARAGTQVATPPTDPVSHRPSAILDSDTVVPSASPVPDSAPSVTAPSSPAPGAQPTASTEPAPPPAPAEVPSHPIQNGDAPPQTDTPRKPPSLYAPGENKDSKDSKDPRAPRDNSSKPQ